MGYQDRHYYRDSQNDRMGPLQWIMSGSVPLFTVFGIHVRAHAAFVLFIGLELLMEPNHSFGVLVTTMGLLFLSVLLHEFGHCFAARWVGGSADDILLWPLGGLAMVDPPHRPLPTFLTTAAGPAVNALLALLCAAVLYFQQHVIVSLNPMRHFFAAPNSWLGYYLWYFYMVNITQLLFNLLPIFPLDGGRMLQSVLWKWMGYGRSLLVASTIGIGGAALLMLYSLAMGPQWLVFAVAITCLMYCIQQRAAVRATGAEGFEEYDYHTGPSSHTHSRHHHFSRFAKWKVRRQIRDEEQEQSKIDAILQKVHELGMHSLTWLEKRTLKRATQRQRQLETEETRYR